MFEMIAHEPVDALTDIVKLATFEPLTDVNIPQPWIGIS